MLECYAKYMMKMDTYCDDNVDGGDLKGGIQGGAHRTAVYLGERCRYDCPSGPERVSTNILVERGAECGPARQTSAAPKIVPVANPTTGHSSTHCLIILYQLRQLTPSTDFVKFIYLKLPIVNI